jgi:restriction endonuclease S subunit
MKKAWPKQPLGELLIERKQRIGTFDADGLPLLGVSNQEGLHRSGMPRISDMSRYLRVEKDWFAYNPMRINVGSIGWAQTTEQVGVISPDYVVFSCSERVLPSLLFSFLKHRRGLQEINAATAGSVRERLYFDKLAQIEFPLPPFTEQRRMVHQIEDLAAQIQESLTLRSQAAEETEKLMGGEERRIWPDAGLAGASTLGNVCTFLARGKQSEQGDSDHFLIKTQHVQQDRYLPTLMRLAPHCAAKVKAEAIVKDGDTLIACSAAGCLGRVARYRDEGKKASTDTHVAIARANSEILHPDYLYAYLRGAQGQHQLRSRERGDWQREKISFRLTELNLNDLRQVPIPVPPIPEQRKIVAELDALKADVEALRGLQAETAAELDALLPSILDRAFNADL